MKVQVGLGVDISVDINNSIDNLSSVADGYLFTLVSIEHTVDRDVNIEMKCTNVFGDSSIFAQTAGRSSSKYMQGTVYFYDAWGNKLLSSGIVVGGRTISNFEARILTNCHSDDEAIKEQYDMFTPENIKGFYCTVDRYW